jgi:DNA-binding MarR family transcriptional regulator
MKRIPLARVQAALRSLHKRGLIEDSGMRRDGQICWQLTPLGRACEANQLEELFHDPTSRPVQCRP